MRRWLAALALAVVVRMGAHAVFLPAFAGPDEPQHLARMRDFAERPFREAFAGASVDAALLEEMGRYPCDAPRRAAAGCPEFAERPGGFDLVRRPPAPAPPRGASPIPNVEANQPPLYYGVVGALMRPFSLSPAAQLLAARLFAVALVAFALFGPLRRLSAAWPASVGAAGLLALLSPGASEALARCSNDAAVFLWAALVLAALARPVRPGPFVLLLAAGPLLKLTAIPIVVFAVVAAARERGGMLSLAGAAAALAVVPVQAARGFLFGGTLELNSPAAPVGEPLGGAVLGLLRSAYAFFKTALWVGGQSLVRPPRWLVAAWGLWLAAAGVLLRKRPDGRRALAHGAAAAAAAGGFVLFAVANRRHYGVWGGVAGWYLWSWSPWIAEAAADLATMPARAVRTLLGFEALLVAVANAAWIAESVRFYGV
ncbi:MAG TPA: hypothetical protein VMN82_16100 [Thermoanaerobaculia bacterium]|nr:hypothetical protein [Thermoanaerobaculia bacterium]